MNRFTGWAIAGTTAALFAPFYGLPGQADSIVPANDGTGTQVTPTDGTYDITGGTPSADQQNLFHSFTEFNLLTGESATFITDPAILNILSRINGGNASVIDGLLQVSGSGANLFLINPSGILLGPNAVLNLQGSFTATTADQVNFATDAFGAVGTPDYAALVGPPQSFSFSLENPGSVVNAGTLSVNPGEAVVLIGGQVLNTGTIAAPDGEVVISAVAGENLVRIAPAGSLLNLEVETLTAADPEALSAFSPVSLPELLTGNAIAQATDVIVNPDGTVQLASGTPINTASGATTVSGSIDVSHTQGGQILVLGNDIALSDTVLNASGTLGGGQIRIGGDYQGQGPLPRAQTTTLDRGSLLRADALDIGDGGTVIVWADGTALFEGLITARGGLQGGDGGLVETSGRASIAIAGGLVDASATEGTAGLWFVDPTDINIDADLAFTIESALAGGTNFTASTIDGDPNVIGTPGGEGDIFLASSINAIAANNATLTLTASRYIQLAPGADFLETINIAGGNLVLQLNQEALADAANPTLSDALDLIGTVTGSTTVNLGPGTYQEPDTLALVNDNFSLIGAGAALTLIDGSDSFGAFTVASGVTATLADLTIADANNFGNGGAIANAGNLTLVNSTIRNNTAQNSGIGGDGGGIFNAGALTLINSTLTANTAIGTTGVAAGGSGGGIYNAGNLEIIDSVITANAAQSFDPAVGEAIGSGGGGGIYNTGTVNSTGTTISGNSALVKGGGIYNVGGAIALSAAVISGNQAAAGGGLLNDSGSITIANSTLSGNAALGNAVLSGNGGGIGNFSDTSSLTITNSTLSNNSAVLEGGAISNAGDLMIDTTTLTGNTAQFSNSSGGAIANNGDTSIANSTLSSNTAGFEGGAISNAGNLTVGNTTFTSNTALGGGAIANSGSAFLVGSTFFGNGAEFSGGAISNAGDLIGNTLTLAGNTAAINGGAVENFGFATITNSTLIGNTAEFYGGAVNNNGDLVVSSSSLSGNTASSGGGINNNGFGELRVERSTLSNNTAQGAEEATAGGGGISNQGGTATVTNSTLSNNRAAAGSGGGISNQVDASSSSSGEIAQGELTVENTTFFGNSAANNGGGLHNEGGIASITSSTLVDNTATGVGGGLSNQTAVSEAFDPSTFEPIEVTTPGALTLTSSIASANTAASGANVFNGSAFSSGGNNLFGASSNAGTVGITGSSSDRVPLPAIAQILQTALADNGGPTETLALLPGSPAIDAGSGAAADQRGVAVVNGTRDIGAFESRGFTLAISGGDRQFTSINQPFSQPLTVAVSSAFGEPVAGGTVTFALPLSSGASTNVSSNPAIIGSSGSVSVSAIANGTAGNYAVTAGTAGARNAVNFNLTNTSTQLPDCVGAACGPPCIGSECPAPPPPPPPALPRSPDAATDSFETYLGVEAAAFEDFDALERAEVITGVAPALVYASFVSSAAAVEVPTTANLTKALSTDDALAAHIIAQAERRQPPATDTPDEPLLELVLVTAGNEPRRFSTGATRREVLAAVRQLHLELTDRTRRRLDNYLIPAQALYGWLLAPLADTLEAEGLGHVSFILDEGLRSLPLAALHDGDQFIIENYSIGLMPSLSLTDTRIGNIRNASVLAMGASQFEDQPPLPAVPLELAAIDRLWSGEQVLNEGFTPDRVVQERNEDPYPILHLATHGQFSDGALSNSYIQFWDRRLTLNDLPQLGLDQPAIELLVLSACRTVLGSEEAELGFAGFAVKSGAKSAIAALWQVSDLETAGLMAELYTQLGQVTYKGEALRQAQLAMLRGEVTVQDGNLIWSGGQIPLPEEFQNLTFADTRHPFYWSAFTLVGSPW